MQRRDFLTGLCTLIGATALPINRLVVDTMPADARIVQPSDSLFLIQNVRIHNTGSHKGAASLTIGDFQLDGRITVKPGEWQNYDLYPGGGYQLDPGEMVSLIGAPDFQLSLLGMKCWPGGRDGSGVMEVIGYMMWARAGVRV